MREYQKHQTTQHRILRFWILAGVVCALFLVSTIAVRAAWGMYGKFSEASNASASAKLELSILQERQTKLSAALLSVSSDRGIESQVRERFGVARPGEGEIHIVRDESDTGVVHQTESENFFTRVFHSLIVW